MPGGGVDFRMKGKWAKLAMVMDPERLKRSLAVNIRRATQFNAALAERRVREEITSGALSPNARLTILIKHSSKPLIDDGDLFGAITSVMVDDNTAFVGVLRTSVAANLAEILHDGATLQVTPAMRGLFLLLARVGEGSLDRSKLTGRAADLADRLGTRIRDIRPLKPSTNVIVIPPRPYLRPAFEDKVLLAKMKKNWIRAADASFRGK